MVSQRSLTTYVVYIGLTVYTSRLVVSFLNPFDIPPRVGIWENGEENNWDQKTDLELMLKDQSMQENKGFCQGFRTALEKMWPQNDTVHASPCPQWKGFSQRAQGQKKSWLEKIKSSTTHVTPSIARSASQIWSSLVSRSQTNKIRSLFFICS